MSLSDKEKEIWEQLETELLAEKPIRKATADMKKESTRGPRHLVIGVMLLILGFIGLIAAVSSSMIIVGLAAFGILMYAANFIYDSFLKLSSNFEPKRNGFEKALENLKNYKPRNDFFN